MHTAYLMKTIKILVKHIIFFYADHQTDSTILRL